MSVIADIIVDDNKLLIHADGTTEKKLELSGNVHVTGDASFNRNVDVTGDLSLNKIILNGATIKIDNNKLVIDSSLLDCIELSGGVIINGDNY